MSNKNFIMVDNDILTNTEELNTYNKIGTQGFALYCYLLSQQNNKSYCQVSIKMIDTFMNREVKNPKLLDYKNKECSVATLKSKKIILNFLKVLNNNEFIELDLDVDYKPNDLITIKVKKCENNKFTMISEELFVDYIHKIGHVGWSLLYILTNLHNYDRGGCFSCGYANPSEEYLKKITKKDIKTIRAYLYLLQDYKLIKIERQERITKGVNMYGVEVYEYLPNNYIVKNRLSDNKYYVGE